MALSRELSAIQTTSPKFVIDIESSGKNWNDHLFLIGYAYNTRDGTIVKGFIAHNPLTETEIRMLKDGILEWIDLWMCKGWEMRCYNEFWHNPRSRDLIPTLEALLFQNENVVNDEFEFAARFNRVLKDAETHWGGNLQIITNTTAYDTCWVHNLLVKHHFQPLDTTRTGKHTWSYDSDSALLGAVGITPHATDWKKFNVFLNQQIKKLPGENVEHDHNPENDAHHILDCWQRFELFQGMVKTNLLDILVCPEEEFEEKMQVHLAEYAERIKFFRQ
jgi:hypothetical protein